MFGPQHPFLGPGPHNHDPGFGAHNALDAAHTLGHEFVDRQLMAAEQLANGNRLIVAETAQRFAVEAAMHRSVQEQRIGGIRAEAAQVSPSAQTPSYLESWGRHKKETPPDSDPFLEDWKRNKAAAAQNETATIPVLTDESTEQPEADIELKINLFEGATNWVQVRRYIGHSMLRATCRRLGAVYRGNGSEEFLIAFPDSEEPQLMNYLTLRYPLDNIRRHNTGDPEGKTFGVHPITDLSLDVQRHILSKSS